MTWLASHGGGLKADWPWRCGAEKVKEVEGGCSRKNWGKRACCHCVTEFVAENYVICLSEEVVLGVMLSDCVSGPQSVYEITMVFISSFTKQVYLYLK